MGVITRRRWGQRGGTAVAFVLSAVCALTAFVVVAAPAQAAVSRPFTIRYQRNDHGDILLRGNSLVTCPPSANCTRAINRDPTLGANLLNNNGYAMQFTDIDGDAATHSSSSADLVLPGGSDVLFSGLYWSGFSASGSSTARTAPPGGTAKNRLLLKAPGDSAYRTITASTIDDSTADGLPYSSFADVTSIVQAAGSGTYTGADIFAATGTDSYAAWTLVTVVRSASMPRRNLTVFDGFGRVASGDTNIDIPLSGFETPPSGVVQVRLGTVAYEGDLGLTGDALQVIPSPGSGVATTTLTEAQNPPDNYFNSTISDNGTAIGARVPDGNTFGFDADVYESNLLLGNNATTATLHLTTGGETYLPAVATFTADIYAPDLSVAQAASVTDTVADGRTRPGDRITYTVDVSNHGQDDASNVIFSDAIPAGTSYVPGSLTIAGQPVTDGGDGDPGEVSGGTVTARLGTSPGGSGGHGGGLALSGTTRVRFTVLITGAYTSGGTIPDSSSVSYDNPDAVLHFQADSNTVTTAVLPAATDLGVTQTATPDVVQRTGDRTVTWTAHLVNNGADTETTPQLVETLPAGVTSISYGGATCVVAGITLTCAVSAIAGGASADVTITAILPAGAADPSAATATVSGAGTDAVPANNSISTTVGVNDAPSSAPATAVLGSSTLSTLIDVLAGDTDPDGDPLHVAAVGTPAHGIATVVGGQVRYVLTDPHFTGTDTVSYTVCDDRSGCATSTFTVTVAAHVVADLAVIQSSGPQIVQRAGNRAVTWTVDVTNSGPDSDAAPVLTEVLPPGATGVVVSGATCSVSGTTLTCPLPVTASGVTRRITFSAVLPVDAPDPVAAVATITGAQLDGDSSNNAVTTSAGVNSAPAAVPDRASLSRAAAAVTIAVRANDSDPDGDPLTVTAVAAPGHGTATLVGGTIVYTVTDLGFAGVDAFTYTVCDGRGGCATTAVTVQVASHGHAPVATDDSAGTPDGAPVVISVLANDHDSDGDVLTLTRIVRKPAHGVVVIAADRLVYAPKPGFQGADSLRYETCDPGLLCDLAEVALTVTSLPPVANPDQGRLRSGGTLVVDVLHNDTDPEGQVLGDVTIVTKPSAGRVTVDPDGRIRYVAPPSGVTGGKVTIRYRTCDPTGACAEGTVLLTVAGTAASVVDGDGPLAFTGGPLGALGILALILMLLGTSAITLSRHQARPALLWRAYGDAGRYRDQPPRR